MSNTGLRRNCYTCRNLAVSDGKCSCAAGEEPFSRERCDIEYAPGGTALEGMRVCTRCHGVYPTADYYRNAHYHGGMDCYCRWCRKELNMERADIYVEERERRRRTDPEFREREREYMRAWRMKNYHYKRTK